MIWAHLFCCKNNLYTLFLSQKLFIHLFCHKKNLRTLFLSRKRFTHFVRKVFARWKLPSGKFRLFGPLQWHRGYNLLLYWQKHKLNWACWACILFKVRFPDPQLAGEHSPVMTDEVPVVGFVNLHRQHCNEHWTTLESCAADAFAFCKLKIIMLHIMHIGDQTKHHNHIYNQTNQKRRSRLKKIASGQKSLTASS